METFEQLEEFLDGLGIPEQVKLLEHLLAQLNSAVYAFAHLQMALAQAQLKPEEKAQVDKMSRAYREIIHGLADMGD